MRELQTEYPEYTIQMYLIGIRYYTKSAISKIIMGKYENIHSHVLGVDEYLTELGTNTAFGSEEKYKEFLNYLANSMFDK